MAAVVSDDGPVGVDDGPVAAVVSDDGGGVLGLLLFEVTGPATRWFSAAAAVSTTAFVGCCSALLIIDSSSELAENSLLVPPPPPPRTAQRLVCCRFSCCRSLRFHRSTDCKPRGIVAAAATVLLLSSFAVTSAPEDGAAKYADTITLLFEGIARVVEVHQPLVETYYGEVVCHI